MQLNTNSPTSSAPPSVGQVFKYVVSHPIEMLFWRWNWKAASLSGVMRGSIYFFTHLKFGWMAALGAMSVEFIFRVLNSGASASVGQAFRKAEPRWLATVCIMLFLPAYSHLIEFSLHTLNGDQNKNKSILISIVFSITSALFNLFAMRRGARVIGHQPDVRQRARGGNVRRGERGSMVVLWKRLLVKDEEQKTLLQDFKKMPRIVVEFVAYPFNFLRRKRRQKKS